MEASGFYISPAMRLRLLKTLDTVWQKGRKVEDLKYLIAPVIAQSPAEQAKFYDLFDRYLEEIQTPLKQVELPKWYERIPKWVYYLIGALFITFLTITLIKVFNNEQKVIPKISFVLPDTLQVNKPFKVTNTSEDCDSLNTVFEWQIWDEEEQELEHFDTSGYDFHHQFETTGGQHNRIVKLLYWDKKTNERDTFVQDLKIHCEELPTIDLEIEKSQWSVGEELIVKPIADIPLENLEITWQMGEESVKGASEFNKSLDERGNFAINFTAKLKKADGHCEQTISTNFSVGDNRAFLASVPLKRDTIKTKAKFSELFWALWMMILAGLVFFFLKWLFRKPPKIEEDPNDKKEKAPTPDRGPYFVPFRNNNGSIKVERELFRFANVLRQRQEGRRLKVDIPKTLQTTIDGGGFPKLVMGSHSRPTEYLFLIEEYSEHSHLTNLFKYITEFLVEKEVLIESFYYNQSFKSFWNKDNPKGLTLDLLRRYYPHHRVVILGDGHHFLDRHSQDKPRLQKAYSNLFRQWKQRILITPMPLESWTFKERVLYNMFTIFPADLDGLHDAMAFLEAGLEAEDASTFNLWMEQFEDNAPAPDVNYLKWRKLDDHKEYLKNHPKLLQWVIALSVYPKPNWNLTIAIGKALQPLGVEVNYENLLILSRIDWLKSGNLNPRLKRELLRNIDPETEKLAREAVQKELASVEHLTNESFAGRALNINSSLNNFSLDPQKKEYQNAIRDLLETGVLTKKHIVELNQDLERKIKPKEKILEKENFQQKMAQSIFSAPPAQPPTIEAFLDENEEIPEPPKKEFFTKDFWTTGVLAAIFAVFSLIYWQVNETDFLHNLAFNESPQPVSNISRDSLRSNLIARQDFEMDSAVYYNNMAVDIWEEYEESKGINRLNEYLIEKNFDKEFINSKIEGSVDIFDIRSRNPADIRIESSYLDSIQTLANISNYLLERAISINEELGILDSNLTDIHYNLGHSIFNRFQNHETDSSYLEEAKSYFETALVRENNHWDALHGKGLVFHNYENLDSVCLIVDRLSEVSKSGGDLGFNFPNLMTIAESCNLTPIIIYVGEDKNLEIGNEIKIALQELGFYISGVESKSGQLGNGINFYNLENEKLALNAANKLIEFLIQKELEFGKEDFVPKYISTSTDNQAEIEIFLDANLFQTVAQKATSIGESIKEAAKEKIKNIDIPEQKTTQKLSDYPALNGRWEVKLYKNGSSVSDDYGYLKANLRRDIIEIYYPKTGCRGTWAPYQMDTNKIYFRESFASNQSCEQNIEILVSFEGSDISASFLDTKGNYEASPSLLKKVPYFDMSSFKWLDGQWEAEVTQYTTKTPSTWSTKLTLNTSSHKYEVNYPTYPCTGFWQVEKLDRNSVWFRETLTENNDCQENILIQIEKLRNDNLKISFYDEIGRREDGNAILKEVVGEPRIFGNSKMGYGLEDSKTGKEILPPTYDQIGNFGQFFIDENLAEVVKNGKHGFIDKSGKIVIPLEYDKIIGVLESNGYKPLHNLVIARKDNLEGVVNNKGEIVHSLLYEQIQILKDGTVKARHIGGTETFLLGDDTPTLYKNATQKPVFSTCINRKSNLDKCTENAIGNFVRTKLNNTKEMNGSFIVSFVITETGKIGAIELKALNNMELGKEVIKIIQKMPQFQPGISSKGVPISVRYELPIKVRK